MFRVSFAPHPKVWAIVGVCTGARAGIRFLTGFGSDPKIFPVPFGFRDRTFLLAGSLKRFCNYQGFEAEVLAIPSIPNRIVRPIVTLRSRSDHRSSQRPVETFL